MRPRPEDFLTPSGWLRERSYAERKANILFFRNCRLRQRRTPDERGLLYCALDRLFQSWKPRGGASPETYLARYLGGKLEHEFDLERGALEVPAGLLFDVPDWRSS